MRAGRKSKGLHSVRALRSSLWRQKSSFVGGVIVSVQLSFVVLVVVGSSGTIGLLLLFTLCSINLSVLLWLICVLLLHLLLHRGIDCHLQCGVFRHIILILLEVVLSVKASTSNYGRFHVG